MAASSPEPGLREGLPKTFFYTFMVSNLLVECPEASVRFNPDCLFVALCRDYSGHERV